MSVARPRVWRSSYAGRPLGEFAFVAVVGGVQKSYKRAVRVITPRAPVSTILTSTSPGANGRFLGHHHRPLCFDGGGNGFG